MTSDVVKELIQNTLENEGNNQNLYNNYSVSTEIANSPLTSQGNLYSTSSYDLASDQSQFSGDVDRWIHGSITNTDTGVQQSRLAVVQRSTLVESHSLDSNGFWYVMALVLPLISVHSNVNWRCTPSMVLNTAEIFLTHLTRVCSSVRAHMRRLAQDQVARDIFATAMDIVLVVYAIGFLVLSMYQASIIG